MTAMKRIVPRIDMRGLKVLDVGCDDGRYLTLPEFAESSCYGVDVSGSRISEGQRKYPHLELSIGPAEMLPYPDAYFDVVTSIVALPYTHIPTALAEMARVLKPGGHLFLTLHGFGIVWRYQLKPAMQAVDIKAVVSCLYIVFSSVVFQFTGLLPRRPWKTKHSPYDTIQWPSRMQKELKPHFDEVMHGTSDTFNGGVHRRHYLITAFKRRNDMQVET